MLAVLDKGTEVEVEKKVDDWLCLTDGTSSTMKAGRTQGKHD